MFTKWRCWFIMNCDKGREVEAIQMVIAIKKKRAKKRLKALEKERHGYRGKNTRYAFGMQRKINSCNKRLLMLEDSEKKFEALQRSNRRIVDKFYNTIK